MTESQARKYHETATGRQAFCNITTNTIKKILRIKSIPRQLLLVDELKPGALPIYDFNDVATISDTYTVSLSSVGHKTITPMFVIEDIQSFDLTDEKRLEKLATLVESISDFFVKAEAQYFCKLLNVLIDSEDSVNNLVNYRYVFCNNTTKQHCEMLQTLLLDVQPKITFFELSQIEDCTLIVCNDVAGVIPVRQEFTMIAVDDPVQRQIGYSFNEIIGMVLERQQRPQYTKIVDHSMTDKIHLNKFKWMSQ